MDKFTKRNTGLDVIRCVALFCVIAVHFFEYIGYYKVSINGTNMLVMTIMRNSFMICVPLFIMLTGYLVMNTQICLKYYMKLIKVLFVYVMASVFCDLFRIFILQEQISVWQTIRGILSFKSAPYSWYIEMYIGLFLIIPFLNILYEGLKNKKTKQILLITLIILTILPSILNIFCVAELNWWAMPSRVSAYDRLVPQWWIQIYPVTYFYIGRFLREYPIKMKLFKNIVLIFFVFIFAGLFNYYRSYNSVFIYGLWQEYGSMLVTVQTVLVFSLLSELRYERTNRVVKNILAKISDLSLGAYLTSWILDQIVYMKLNYNILDINQKLLWFFFTTPIILMGSLLLSGIINYLYRKIMQIVKYL